MASNKNQSQLFLSYNHDSGAIVTKIREKLLDKFSVWIDREGIAPGSDAWKMDVTKGLLESEIVICFITKLYCESTNCLDELEFSVQKKKRILCILLEDLSQYENNINVAHVQFCIVRRNLFYAYKAGRTFDPWSESLFRELVETIYSLGGQALAQTGVFAKATVKRYKDVSEKYEIDELIGEGAFSKVYLVKDKLNDEKKAMKVITTVGSYRDLNKTLNEMKREADVHVGLKHENIVQFYECFEALKQSCYCMVIEYCESGSLASVLHSYALRQKQIEESTRKKWMLDLSAALNYLHVKDVIHRDIVAENIFVKNKMIKIGDFGVSRYNFISTLSKSFSKNIGSARIKSPEMLRNEPYGTETDVWSLGCVFFEIETLEGLYFEDEQLLEQMEKQEKLKKLDQNNPIRWLIIKIQKLERPSSKEVFEEMKRILGASLTDAIENKNLEKFQRLISKGINVPDLDGWTPLTAACKEGETEVVQFLLNEGVDINAPDQKGRKPLTAACGGGKTETAELLLKKGANINEPDKFGGTPLTAACWGGETEVVELLLNKGVDMNAPLLNGFTPLTFARKFNKKDIERLLLSKGASNGQD